MKFSLRIVFFLTLAVIGAAVVSANLLLGRIARSEEFKRFAEQKIGEYLKAKVNIGEIRPYRFNQIALEKIIIETPSAKSGSQLVRLERLIFRYRWDQLWRRRFDAPAAVVLKNPSILIEQDQFPYRYFENSKNASVGFSMPVLDFNGGEIRYLLPAIGKEILLTEVEGKILPSLDQKVEVDVRAQAAGFLDGKVHIYGVVHPSKQSHDLWLELDGMNFSKDIPLPFREIKGKIHWVGQDLFFDGLQASFHGWQTEISGAFEHHDGFPQMKWQILSGKAKPGFKLDFSLDFSKQKLAGVFQPIADHLFPFTGKVRQEGKRFVMDSLTVEPDCKGWGELDFTTGNYQFSFEQGTKRLAVHSNLQGLDFAIYFHFDHLKLYNLDIVTQGKMFLHSASTRWAARDFMFKGALETDYLILDQQPFEDFKATFDITPLGATGIRSSWGKQFQMTGQLLFPEGKPQGKLLTRVSDFDLGHVQEFASKPLPKELGGFLSGKLVIQGDIEKPDVIGVFNIREGKWGRLHYDHGIIQFRGIPPFLPLQESKVWKGRTTFYLTGALDLKLDNVFAGVKIETPDHLVIWKGIEAVLHEKDGSLELNRSELGKWGEFSALEATAKQTSPARAPDTGAEDSEEEETVTVGPKLKF